MSNSIISWGTIIKAAVPFRIPTNNEWKHILKLAVIYPCWISVLSFVFFFFLFLIIGVLTVVWWYFVVVLICICFMTNNIEHLFIWLFTICVFPLLRCLLCSLFLSWMIFFLYCYFVRELYIFWTQVFCQIHITGKYLFHCIVRFSTSLVGFSHRGRL